MKIRNGFVSNSSSSSFVVNNKDFGKDVSTLSSDAVEFLLQEGFVGSNEYFPLSVQVNGVKSLMSNAKVPRTYIKNVFCNQSDVIEMLYANAIPFTAFCHYGCQLVAYDVEKKPYFLSNNYVNIEKSEELEKECLKKNSNVYKSEVGKVLLREDSDYVNGIDAIASGERSAIVVQISGYLGQPKKSFIEASVVNELRKMSFIKSFCVWPSLISLSRYIMKEENKGNVLVKVFHDNMVVNDMIALMSMGVKFHGSLRDGKCLVVFDGKSLFLVDQWQCRCWDWRPWLVVRNILSLRRFFYSRFKDVSGKYLISEQ